MTNEQRKTIANQAIAKYGYMAQLRQLQEECAELIVAISHYIRDDRDELNELNEELADVIIMLMQLVPSYNIQGEITRIIDEKLEKLSKKLCAK